MVGLGLDVELVVNEGLLPLKQVRGFAIIASNLDIAANLHSA